MSCVGCLCSFFVPFDTLTGQQQGILWSAGGRHFKAPVDLVWEESSRTGSAVVIGKFVHRDISVSYVMGTNCLYPSLSFSSVGGRDQVQIPTLYILSSWLYHFVSWFPNPHPSFTLYIMKTSGRRLVNVTRFLNIYFVIMYKILFATWNMFAIRETFWNGSSCYLRQSLIININKIIVNINELANTEVQDSSSLLESKDV